MLTAEAYQDWTERVCAFHTKRAPGIAVGVIMVDYAQDLLGETKDKVNAVCETQACLSDVLQVMTGCTIGNRYLRVLKDIGRYALTLFDRADGRGVRVFVDLNKIDADRTPELFRFFSRTREPEVRNGGPARTRSGKKIIEEFDTVKRAILSYELVQVHCFGKPPMLPARICGICEEAFLTSDQEQTACVDCQESRKYYRLRPA